MLVVHRRIVELLVTGRWHEVAMLSMVCIICWLVRKPRRLVVLHLVVAVRFEPVQLCETVNSIRFASFGSDLCFADDVA